MTAEIVNLLNDPTSIALSRANDFASAADAWAISGIADEPAAERCADLLRVIRTAAKTADDDRKSEVEPHRLASIAINARWKPVTDILCAAESAVKKVLLSYTAAQEERRRAEAAAAALAAAEAKRKAEDEARRAAEANTVVAAVAAKRAADQAAEATAAALSIPAKVSIGGVYGRAVTTRKGPSKARIAKADDEKAMNATERAAALWALKTFRIAMLELVIKLASAEARAKRPLPACFEVYHEETVG